MRKSSHWLQYGYITLVILIWFIPSMCSYVAYKNTMLWESHITLVTILCFFPNVYPHMSYEITILCKSKLLIKNAYYIEYIDMAFPQCDSRYVCEVLSFVKEIIIVWETIVTLVTMIWFLHRVYSHIVYKITIIWEIYVTLVTISYGL